MSKRPRPNYKLDESSGSGNQTDDDSNPSPKKRVNIQSSIRTSQKFRLTNVDGGKCLITGEVDGACIEVCHLLRHKEHEDNLTIYERCFGMTEELNIDSIRNLVHLRADWHRSFDADCWALVPTMAKLEDIIRRLETRKKWRFSQVDAERHNYQFISFPSLGQKPIHRVTEDDDDEYTRIAHEDMPILQSHIHPYFVIANALPKFQQAIADLTPQQRQILRKLVNIEILWYEKPAEQTASGSGTGQRRGGGEGGGGGGGGRSSKKGGGGKKSGGGKKGGGSRGNRGGRTGENSGGGMGGKAGDKIGKARGHNGDNNPNRVQGRHLPTPVSTSTTESDENGEFTDDMRKIVLDWREQFTEAGPLEPVKQKIVWSVKERARQPYRGDWGDWRAKWDSSPPDRSKFTSNDWAIYWKMFNLPRHRD